MKKPDVRTCAGLGLVLTIVVIVAVAIGMFQGSFTKTVPVTVTSDRAGLVMNPDARVKLHGAEVGRVESIQARPDGSVALHLALDPTWMELIPANVTAAITSSTVFGAKFVELIPPEDPSAQALRAGQIIDGQRVTVEINTVFQQLVAVLDKIEPAKLNETLGALSTGLSGRGAKIGQLMSDLDEMLTKINPSLPNLSHDISVAPEVLNTYADAAPDLMNVVSQATTLGDTLVDQQDYLDTLLISVVGLADTGQDLLATNRQGITDVLHLLVPTTDLTNQYNPALTCALAGLAPLANGPPPALPGVMLLDSFVLGRERYRYPQNLPKVAATGGPQCAGLPDVGYEGRAPFVVTDIGADQAQYGNQGIVLNSDALKQWLFGPIDGPPRNTAQIGQPG